MLYRTITLVTLTAALYSGSSVSAFPTPVNQATLRVKAEAICDGASNLEAHWSGVAKNGAGRVTEAAFIDYFWTEYNTTSCQRLHGSEWLAFSMPLAEERRIREQSLASKHPAGETSTWLAGT